MAKSAKKKDEPKLAEAEPARKEPYVVDVEESLTFSVRLKLSTGDKLDLLAAGGGSFEANKEIRQLAVDALRNSLR